MFDGDATDPKLNDCTLVMGAGDRPVVQVYRRTSLVALAGWDIGREIELTDHETILGRSPHATVCINSPSVSREHAKIIRRQQDDSNVFELIDLNSSNGTYINNVHVKSAELCNGDKLKMGDVLFRFVYEDVDDSAFYQNIHRLIHYDQLTGLLKMEHFRHTLEAEVHRKGPPRPLTLAMTDLDGLKRVNDTFGHLAGRMVVREMGAMIREAIRPQDRAGLYGGDESIIFFPGTPLEEAMTVAEKLRVAIEQRIFDFHGKTLHVTISQGLAEWPRNGKTIEELIAAADRALYAAKAAGRNCVQIAAS